MAKTKRTAATTAPKATRAETTSALGSEETLAELAPRLARQMEELIGDLNAERFEERMTADSATRLRRAFAAGLESRGIPHTIDTAPMSPEAWAAIRTRRVAALRELQLRVARDSRAFAAAFEKERGAVTGVVHRPFFECRGRGKVTSACEALLHAVRGFAEIIDARPLRLDDLDSTDGETTTWYELRLGVEVEVAELLRQENPPHGEPISNKQAGLIYGVEPNEMSKLVRRTEKGVFPAWARGHEDRFKKLLAKGRAGLFDRKKIEELAAWKQQALPRKR